MSRCQLAACSLTPTATTPSLHPPSYVAPSSQERTARRTPGSISADSAAKSLACFTPDLKCGVRRRRRRTPNHTACIEASPILNSTCVGATTLVCSWECMLVLFGEAAGIYVWAGGDGGETRCTAAPLSVCRACRARQGLDAREERRGGEVGQVCSSGHALPVKTHALSRY